MVKPVHPIDDVVRHAVEIVVHVKDLLGDEQQRRVVSSLVKTEGIVQAEFCPMRNHLVRARYNRNLITSLDVIKSFRSLNLDARLIGPI
jgi:hypothetical protein